MVSFIIGKLTLWGIKIVQSMLVIDAMKHNRLLRCKFKVNVQCYVEWLLLWSCKVLLMITQRKSIDIVAICDQD